MANAESIQQIDIETGEVGEVLLKLASRYPENGMVIMADVHNGIVEAKDIRIFPKTKQAKQIEQTEEVKHVPEELLEKGMCDIQSSNQFSKVFHHKDPAFSKDTYYKYWYNICRHLSQDTNIVISRKPIIHFVHEIREFEAICGSSKYVNYRFIKECKDKGLLAVFILSGKKVFVADPRYTLNGNKMPVILVQLFQDLNP